MPNAVCGLDFGFRASAEPLITSPAGLGFVRPDVFELCVPNPETIVPRKQNKLRPFTGTHTRPLCTTSESLRRRSTCSTCVGATAARANRFAHGIHRIRSLVGAFFHTEPAGTCASQGAHMPLPLRLPSSLSRLWFFSRDLSAVARRQKSASLLSAPARFAAT